MASSATKAGNGASSSAAAAPAVVLVTAGYDHSIKFWEATTGECQKTVQYADSQVNCLEISSDKSFLAVGGKQQVRLYDINSASTHPLRVFDGHTGNVTALGFQKDAKWFFSCSEDSTVKIWDPRAGGSFQRDYRGKSPFNCATLHPNQGEILSGDDAGNIFVWELASNQCLYELVPENNVAVRTLSVASDASVLVACNNKGTVFSWKLEQKSKFEPLQKIDAHSAHILKCVLSPDARYLATASADKTVKIWDTQSNFGLYKTLKGHQRWVWDCAWSADSAYLVTASSDCTARLWDLKLGESIIEYKAHQKAVTSIALNDY